MDKKYDYFISNSYVYAVLVAVLIVIIFISGQYIIGAVSVFIYIALIIYNIKRMRDKKHEWIKFIEDFSDKLDVATRNTLVKFPFPLIIVGVRGNILWYNQNFSSIFKGDEILGRHVKDVMPNYDFWNALNDKSHRVRAVSVNERYYDIYSSKVNTNDTGVDTIILLYLYDVTEVINIVKKAEETREDVMLLEVDNLSEVIKMTDEEKKPFLIAEIDKTINSYAQGMNAMVEKYSNSKYVLCIQDKYIESQIEKKFNILDKLREIDIGNKLAVTLSIGIGKGGETPLENYGLASSAKDLALGRGGDQAVIKSKDKLSFFGGMTKEFEKRTKVRARVIAHALVNLINESSKVYIMGHINADVDSIGSAIGISSVVRKLKKQCYITIEEENNHIKDIIDSVMDDGDYRNTFVKSTEYYNGIDERSLLIIVDVHSAGYVQDMDFVRRFKRVVIIDHHRKSTDAIKGAILSYIETYASSTCELVTEMIQYMIDNPKLKGFEAEALLAGICVDTKNFYFKTGVRTFEAAAFLRSHGADTMDVKKLFSDNLDTYLKRAEIIKAAEVKNGIAIAVSPDNIADNVIAAQAADQLVNITGIQASFVLAKIEGEIHISGRSLGNINVQLILESLGGGGHFAMAGANLKSCTMDEAVSKLKVAIDKYFEEGEK